MCVWVVELFIKHLRLTLRHLCFSLFLESLPACLSLFIPLLLFSLAFHFPFLFFDISFCILIWNSGKLLPASSACIALHCSNQLVSAFINDATLLAHYKCNCRTQLQLQLVCESRGTRREETRRDEVVNQSNRPITRWASNHEPAHPMCTPFYASFKLPACLSNAPIALIKLHSLPSTRTTLSHPSS